MVNEAKILIFIQVFEGLWVLYCCLLQNQFVASHSVTGFLPYWY